MRRGTWYDQSGQNSLDLFNSSGLPGVGWLDEQAAKAPAAPRGKRSSPRTRSELTCTAIDDTLPGGPREVTRHFVGPFTHL